MKTKNKHTLLLILTMVMILSSLLVACAPTEEPTGEIEKDEISILYIDDPTWWSEQAMRFTDDTGIEVNWEGVPFDKFHDKMFTSFAAGDYPWDVIHVRDDWVAEFGSRGFLLPLDDYITPEFKSLFPEDAWDNLSYDGHIYGVPRYFWLYQFYYNKDILAEAGYEDSPQTWDEVAEIATAITSDTDGDGEIDRWGYCETWGENFVFNPFIIHLHGAGGKLFDDAGNPTFNSEAGVQALTWMVEMANTDSFCPSAFEMMTTGVVTELFLQGQVAMIPCTPQVYGMAADPAKSKLSVEQIGVSLMPGDAIVSGTVAETGGIGIPVNAENPDDAWEYIKFVTSYEEQKRMAMEPGNVPALIEALEDPEIKEKQPNFYYIEDQMQYPFGTVAHPRAQEVIGAISRNIIEALHGNTTPEAALEKANQEVLDIINQ